MELWVSIVGSLSGVVAVTVAVLQFRRTPPRESGQARALPDTPRGSLPPPVGRLPSVVRGRDALVHRLAELVEAPDGNVHVLAGLGGVGKSTVALSLADTVGRAGAGVWWISALDHSTLNASLTILARELGADVAEIEDVAAGRLELSDLLWTYLPTHRRWLLVLDNADDLAQLEMAGRGADDGSGLVRPCGSGLMLVTSRVGDPALWGRHAHVHRVDALGSDDGAQALLDLAPGAGSFTEARVLSQRLGGLPLGLHHAGSYLASPFATEREFSAYRHSLDDEAAALLARGSDDRSMMKSTWNLSVHALANQGIPQAEELLHLLSMFAVPETVPAHVFSLPALTALCHPHPVEKVLSGLLSVGLIDWRRSGHEWSVSVHPLVAEVQRYNMTEEQRGTEAIRVARALHEAQRDLDLWQPADWPVWRQLVPHLIVAAERAERLPEEDLGVLLNAIERTVEAMVAAGEHALAESLGRRALAATGGRGDDDPAWSGTRMAVALALRVRGRLDEAEHLYGEVIAALQRTSGARHPLILRCRYQLAMIDYGRNDLAAAEGALRAVLEEMRSEIGLEHATTRMAQFSLALTLRRRGEDRSALAELDDFLQSWSRSFGEEHPYTLYARQERAYAKSRLGDTHEAEAELRATLQAQTRVLGEDHHSTLTTRQSLAVLRHGHGEHVEAERELTAVINLRRRLFGARQVDTRAAERALEEIRRQVAE
ncbi:tetratricopeptide repeat protein [Actinomadura madurae]|uniref:tetratricopeptide repeat protein n=1 Tax=Actinomadura madurae TaxID=1993 RepID=UPI0020260530|nr:tetratricopeptide repeat protein [Actinomadura madurae]URN00912.1 tetratricopeptide repeat protein [Actinomadura madurae]URN03062.1 tetratricopeptide repeat protein [Actinomadura madurae]